MMRSLNVFTFIFFLALGQTSSASSAHTISHGMDMDMDMGMSLAFGQMLPYLHFSGSDILWFQGWVPQSKGAIGGACIGLFMLAIFDRWVSAIRSAAEVHWKEDAQMELANRLNTGAKASSRQIISRMALMRTIPPFIPANDITRGLFCGAQTLLGYTFMLVLMTYNAGFMLSITFGLGVGEMLYGRFSNRGNECRDICNEQ